MACRHPFPPFLIRTRTAGRKATGPARRGEISRGAAPDWRAAPAAIAVRNRRAKSPRGIVPRRRQGTACGAPGNGARRAGERGAAGPGTGRLACRRSRNRRAAGPARPRASPARPRASPGRPRASPGRPRASLARPRASLARPRVVLQGLRLDANVCSPAARGAPAALARPAPARCPCRSRRAGHSVPLRGSRIPFPARFPTRETPIVGRRAPRESVNAGPGRRRNPLTPFTGKRLLAGK
jgi:hypothetical protein